MDGMTLAERIQDRGLTMPIMLLSSNPATRRESESPARLAAILQKPALRSELYRRLQALTAPVAPVALVASPIAAPAGNRVMRVLAAEDNRTNQLVFRKMVKDIDIDLTFAGNGREAVDLYLSFKPDMIFMDISMPEMDGREAAEAIRALEAGGKWHVPIVALTAHAMDGDSDSIFAAGIDRYMTKPLRKSAIMGALAEFCPSDARPIVPEEAMTGT
jgi:CheY-like chemotaxis protein